QIGGDSIRLALASYPTQSRHISLSEKRFESFRNFNNKLWNASRFVLMNTADLQSPRLDKLTCAPAEGFQLEDAWILGALQRTITRATGALEKFEYDQYID